MSTAKRRIDPGITRRLFTEPYRFEFYQAVRILERVFVNQGELPGNALAHRIRFANTLNMGFPPSEIEALVARGEDGSVLDPEAAWNAESGLRVDKADMTPAFMGMLGVQGVLPNGYTEQFGLRETYHRDRAARAFLDIFTNRAVALMYSAWKKYRLAFQYELDSKSRYLPLILSLAGLGSPAMRAQLGQGQNNLYEQAAAYYGGGIMQRPVSATMLRNILAEYLDVPLRIEQFVGAWYDIPEDQRSCLGDGKTQLGISAMSGSRVWQRNLRMCIWIGPLRQRRFEQFLPGGKAASALAKWLALLGGDSFEYQVRLTLHRDDVKAVALGSRDGARLGWGTYASTRASGEHRSGTTYLVHTIN